MRQIYRQFQIYACVLAGVSLAAFVIMLAKGHGFGSFKYLAWGATWATVAAYWARKARRRTGLESRDVRDDEVRGRRSRLSRVSPSTDAQNDFLYSSSGVAVVRLLPPVIITVAIAQILSFDSQAMGVALVL